MTIDKSKKYVAKLTPEMFKVCDEDQLIVDTSEISELLDSLKSNIEQSSDPDNPVLGYRQGTNVGNTEVGVDVGPGGISVYVERPL